MQLKMSTPLLNFSSDPLNQVIYPILETMQLPVAIMEPLYESGNNLNDFRYISINEYGCKSYLLLKEDITGKSILELFPSYKENGLFEKLKLVYETGVNLIAEPVKSLNISISASKLGDYLVMNWIDTALLQVGMNTIKILQNSNEELEQFAYIASHDLQEPIRMVISFTQLLQRRYADKLDEDANEFIAFAVDGAQRMKLLIDNLLIYSRSNISGGKIEPVSVESVIKNIVDDFKILINETGIKIKYEDLPVIYTDASMFARILTNLVSNAIKFRQAENPEIKIFAERKDSFWVFSVADNGIGIENNYFEKIFMIFQRLHGGTKYPGTGLGLAICKRIIEKLGGKIWLKSQPGVGTTFYFSIPVKEGNNDNKYWPHSNTSC